MRREDRFWTRCRRETGPQTRTVLGSCLGSRPATRGGGGVFTGKLRETSHFGLTLELVLLGTLLEGLLLRASWS